ncbi:hypothetical protein Ahy_A08g039987 [Arachis hypogaea]|uniref:Uncharacterized protein n=1 Tax=Arachis hypogaea TaxID=3818 RepID=A0A445BYG5_ARAHY|nr:hypothetical protein Ahy_A08g039987 [Arachis hypogaea]
MNLPYTIHVAKKFKIPRVSFAGVSCFCLMCYDALCTSLIFLAKSSNIFGKQTIQPRINPLIQIIPRSLCNRISKSNPTNNRTEHYSRSNLFNQTSLTRQNRIYRAITTYSSLPSFIFLTVHAEVKGSQENASESSHCRDADHTSEAYSGRNNWRSPWGPIFSSFSSVTPYTFMTDQSGTHQHAGPDLVAVNAALLAENQRMAELLATLQNKGERKNVNKEGTIIHEATIAYNFCYIKQTHISIRSDNTNLSYSPIKAKSKGSQNFLFKLGNSCLQSHQLGNICLQVTLQLNNFSFRSLLHILYLSP